MVTDVPVHCGVAPVKVQFKTTVKKQCDKNDYIWLSCQIQCKSKTSAHERIRDRSYLGQFVQFKVVIRGVTRHVRLVVNRAAMNRVEPDRHTSSNQ